MSDFAVNDKGDVLAFDGKEWKPAQVAVNDKGEKVAFDGRAWKPLSGQSTTDVNEGMRDAFGNGLLFNFGDEAKAAAKATVPGVYEYFRQAQENLPDWLTGPKKEAVSQAPDWNTRYTEALAKERANAKAFEESNPNLATASNVAGNVAGSAAALAAGPAGLISRGASLFGNAAKIGGVGGALGGVAGFGEGEGDFGGRASNAVIPAAVGFAAGGLTPFAGAAGRKALETAPGRYVSEKVVSPLARMIAQKVEGGGAQSLSAAAPDGTAGIAPGPLTQFANSTGNVADTGAIDRLTTALQRSGMTPEQITTKLKTLGPEAMLADVDPQFLSAATGAKVLPGQTRTTAENVLEGRNRQFGNMMTKAFEGSEPPPSAYALRGEGQAFDQNLRAVGNRAYDAMDAAGLKQTPELMKLYENPIVDRAINKVMSEEKATRVGTSRAAASPVDIMHKVKQEIQDMGVAETGRGSSTQSYFRDLAGEYVRALKSANPKLAEADAAYTQAASLPEHFDVGAALLAREGTSEPALEKSAARLTDLLAKADPQQALAARVGATNAARNQAQESTSLARSLAKRVDESAPVQSKLAALYGPDQAGEIARRAAAVKQFGKTSDKLLGGSQTAEKSADALETNAGIRITNSSASARVVEHLGDIYRSLVSGNEPVRDAIGRATLNMDPSEKARLVRLIAANLARRQQGSPLAASIAGSSGNLIPSR